MMRYPPDMPALFTQTSILPKAFRAASKSPATSAGRETSATKPLAAIPSRLNSSTQEATAAAVLEDTITLAPERPQPSAIALPIPRVEPVTTTTFSSSSFFMAWNHLSLFVEVG